MVQKEVRTFIDVDGSPQGLALANYACLAPTKRSLDHSRDLNREAVGNTSVNDRVRGDTPDGARHDDVRLDIS